MAWWGWQHVLSFASSLDLNKPFAFSVSWLSIRDRDNHWRNAEFTSIYHERRKKLDTFWQIFSQPNVRANEVNEWREKKGRKSRERREKRSNEIISVRLDRLMDWPSLAVERLSIVTSPRDVVLLRIFLFALLVRVVPLVSIGVEEPAVGRSSATDRWSTEIHHPVWFRHNNRRVLAYPIENYGWRRREQKRRRSSREGRERSKSKGVERWSKFCDDAQWPSVAHRSPNFQSCFPLLITRFGYANPMNERVILFECDHSIRSILVQISFVENRGSSIGIRADQEEDQRMRLEHRIIN